MTDKNVECHLGSQKVEYRTDSLFMIQTHRVFNMTHIHKLDEQFNLNLPYAQTFRVRVFKKLNLIPR